MKTVLINISGMSCQHCAASVRTALAAIPGVGEVEVALERGQARISFDPQQASTEQMRTAIENAGFDVH